MKLLDKRGFFYTVYDMGNGRVQKIEKPRIVQYLKHFFFAGRLPKEVRKSADISYKVIGSSIDPALLAHPKIESDRSYSQDKVLILEQYIPSHTLEENKKIIDLYANHILETWKNGFSDKIFNFTHNCGIDARGKIVLVDFNEITFNKEEVRSLINKQRWLHAFSSTYHLSFNNKGLWKYYKEVMAEKITSENLDIFFREE